MTGRGRPRINGSGNASQRGRAKTYPQLKTSSELSSLEGTLKDMLGELRDLKRTQKTMSDTHGRLLVEVRGLASDQKNMKNELKTGQRSS